MAIKVKLIANFSNNYSYFLPKEWKIICALNFRHYYHCKKLKQVCLYLDLSSDPWSSCIQKMDSSAVGLNRNDPHQVQATLQ